MIEFEQAIEIIKSNYLTPKTETIPLKESLNRVLAQNVFADRDMPPFDKSAVDGYACKKEEISLSLQKIETIPAGTKPQHHILPRTCSQIMTGAMIPQGANCVVMVEDTICNNGIITISQAKIDNPKFKSNICKKGEDLKKGEIVLQKGELITTSKIGSLSNFGYSQIDVYKRPSIGIISTGDEIIPNHLTSIEEYQIRDINGPMLESLSSEISPDSHFIGIVKDDKEKLRDALYHSTNKFDITIISGGVSEGKYDYVPHILNEIGFEILFNRVAVQPGKPATFAIKKNSKNTIERVVFALPGNPVSSLIQFHLMIKPLIYRCMSYDYNPQTVSLKIDQYYKRKSSERTSLIPGRIQKSYVSPIVYNGSAHILSLIGANGVIVIPKGVKSVEKGDYVQMILLNL